MARILASVLLVALIQSALGASTVVKTGMQPKEGVYVIHTIPQSWSEAQAQCKLVDMSLVTLSGEEETRIVLAAMVEHGVSTATWVGGLGDVSGTKYIWVSSGEEIIDVAVANGTDVFGYGVTLRRPALSGGTLLATKLPYVCEA